MEVVAGLSLKNLRPRVWDPQSREQVPALRAVMLSFDELRRRPELCLKAKESGLHSVLGLSGDSGPPGTRLRLFLDNGAFACLRRGDEPATEEFVAFVREVRPDWYPVPADYIPLPSFSRQRQKRLFEKTVTVLDTHSNDGFCPVIHPGPWLGGYLAAISRLKQTRQLAIGGLVPHLLNSPGAQRRETIKMLCRVRREFSGKIHAFGIGGIVTLHLAAAIGIDSVDSSGWRQRAARGLILLRGRGERQAVKLGTWKGRKLSRDEWSELDGCRCPSCRRRESGGLRDHGVEGFAHRAVHNLYVLLAEAILINRHLTEGDFPAWTSGRLGSHPMSDLVKTAMEI